jgi:hypothetical protein
MFRNRERRPLRGMRAIAVEFVMIIAFSFCFAWRSLWPPSASSINLLANYPAHRKSVTMGLAETRNPSLSSCLGVEKLEMLT